MAEARSVAVFCDDRAHEALARAVLARLATEHRVSLDLRFASSRGGHPRVIAELKAFQQQFARRWPGAAQLLVVMVDANCLGWAQARKQCADEARLDLFPHIVVGCPDPHVERWYLADKAAFQAAVGARPEVTQGKCDRDYCKRAFATAVRQAGEIAVPDLYAFAPDIVDHLDLRSPDRLDRSFQAFLSDLRDVFRQWEPEP